MSSERVVVTGYGMVSPIGVSREETARNLLHGRSGVARTLAFGARTLAVPIAAEVRNWHARERTRIRSFLMSAVQQALHDAGINARHHRLGIVLAVGKEPVSLQRLQGGAVDLTFEQAREPAGEPTELARSIGAAGPMYGVYTACASGNDAIGLALRLLRRREVDIVLCASADAQVHPVSLLEFTRLNALAVPGPDGGAHPRPFDRSRNGFVIGEGAAAFILETREHATRRAARVHAAVLGYGSASDAHGLTRGHPDAAGAVGAMRMALLDAGLAPDAIDHINAHGTGTPVNDVMETRAIKQVFQQHAARVPITSTKSMTGHLLAAASAVELAFCLIAIRDGFVPPTINLTSPDPECDLDYVPQVARKLQVQTVMSNAFGFGGQNASVIVGAMPK